MALEHRCLDWFAGASSQLEIFAPGTAAKGVYKLKYTPPMRTTIRPPVQDRPLSGPQLAPVNVELDGLGKSILAVRDGGKVGALAPAAGADIAARMENLGGILHDLMLPIPIQADLRPSGVFLEIGIDETLLGYPWELMHDGDKFLCLKHAVGRFINGSASMAGNIHGTGRPTPVPLQALVISIDQVVVHADGSRYESLPGARKEREAICEELASLGIYVDVLSNEKATLKGVRDALRAKEYQLLHYCGHATFNDADPQLSSLILFDQQLSPASVMAFITKAKPILCFINACESVAANGRELFNVYGLARAFLETGAYLLGSRWKVADDAAAGFATKFYSSFIGDCQPLGVAVRDARIACRNDWPNDPAWASYVLYGDPRVYFRKELAAPPAPGGN